MNYPPTNFDVTWYCPYCGKQAHLTNNQWQEKLRTQKYTDDYFPYCTKQHKFLKCLKGDAAWLELEQ